MGACSSRDTRTTHAAPAAPAVSHMTDLERVSAAPPARVTTLKGYTTVARVVNVHDGDTVRLAYITMPGGPIVYSNCRIAHIDAPELKTDAGEHAREVLERLLLMRTVDVEFEGPDKYGRELVRLHTRESVAGVSVGAYVAQYMLDMGLAVPYEGGRRHA